MKHIMEAFAVTGLCVTAGGLAMTVAGVHYEPYWAVGSVAAFYGFIVTYIIDQRIRHNLIDLVSLIQERAAKLDRPDIYEQAEQVKLNLEKRQSLIEGAKAIGVLGREAGFESLPAETEI